MIINKYQEFENLDAALKNGDPMLAVIAFDCSAAWYGHIDECAEHHILLSKVGLPSVDIDKYFRIVFDNDGADWTFICPPDYKNIKDKTRRIHQFYKDGFSAISDFMSELGLLVDIKIPMRYRRHFNVLGE